MAESEGAVELKKTSAEMILNVAREGAARVADAERRASGFRSELCFVREEAVRMLMRLKRMLDARTLEAEVAVARKEENISVLGLQLEETESKILDLRMELENFHDELKKEKTKNNVPSSVESKSSSGSDLPDTHWDSFQPIVPYFSDSELENAANLDIKERLVTSVATIKRSCNGINLVEQLGDPGRTDPELHGNGSSQGVRVFEGHLLPGASICKLDCSTRVKGENTILSVSPSKNLETEKIHPFLMLERPVVKRKNRRRTAIIKKSKITRVPIYAKQWRKQHVDSLLPAGKFSSPIDCSEFGYDLSTNQIKNAENVDVQDSTLKTKKRSRNDDKYAIECDAVELKGTRKARGRKPLMETFSEHTILMESSRPRLCQGQSVEMNTTSKGVDGGGKDCESGKNCRIKWQWPCFPEKRFN